MKRFIVFLVPVALLLSLVLTGCGRSGEAASEQQAPPVAVKTVTVTSQDLPVEFEATGTVVAVRQAELAFKVMGRTAAVYVHEGDRVQAGQLLARLEAKDLAAGVAQAEAGLKNALAAREQAKTALTMQVTQSSVDLQQAEAQLAKAKQGPRPEQVKQAEAGEKQAKAAYEEALAWLDLTKAGARQQEKRKAEQGVLFARQQVTQAQAQLDTAQAALSTTQADYDRMKNLYDMQVIPKQQLDHVALQLESAKQGVKQAESGVVQAKAGVQIALENQSIAMEGARTQQVTAAEQKVAQAKAAYDQAKQAAEMAHQGGRWEDVKTAEEAVRSAKAAQGRNKVSEENVKRAEAAVAQAKAAVQAARVMLGYATLRAPFAGVITSRMIDPGDMASPGMPVLTMDDDSLYQLNATVAESDAAHLKLGQVVTALLPSVNNSTVQARISRIVPAADPTTRTFMVKADLPHTAGLKSGLFGQIRATTGHKPQLLVARQAILESNGLTEAYVVDDSGRARLTLVKTGKQHGDLVQVLSGLHKGQKVISGPFERIVEGAPVTESGDKQ